MTRRRRSVADSLRRGGVLAEWLESDADERYWGWLCRRLKPELQL